MKTLNFEKGQECRIKLYPQEDIVSGRYIREDNTHYIFECSDDSIVRVNKHFATLDGNVITHDSTSSFAIFKLKPRGVRL